jgi:hypothetical protein
VPTPFTHLAVAQRLLRDQQVPSAIRSHIERELPAYLLGNIAADARVSGGITREATHFFSYDRAIERHPWRVMLADHPSLQSVTDAAQQAFLAGYVAHLSMDETWSLSMVRPHFVGANWGTRQQRFLMLHIILIFMDERDYGVLEGWQRSCLCAAAPRQWIPFLSDDALADWRDFIGTQIPPGGTSLTLQVLGERISLTPQHLRGILDDTSTMDRELWSHIPQDLLAQVEQQMYAHARTQMCAFFDDR